MSELVSDSVLAALQKTIRQESSNKSKAVASGNCKDIEEYRYRTGVIRGMDLIEDELIALNKRMEET